MDWRAAAIKSAELESQGLVFEMIPPGAQKQIIQTPAFAPFFILAAIDAIFAAGAWLPSLVGGDQSWPHVEAVALWHPRELLLGYLGAVLSGFFLTALPRWTRRQVPLWSVRAILALWLVARFAPLPPSPFAFAAALPCGALAIAVAFHVAAAKDARNMKTAALLWLYAGAGLFLAGSPDAATRDFAFRLAVAAMIGLVTVIGGRVIPELTRRFDSLCGGTPDSPGSQAVERLGALSIAIGLVGWLLLPGGGALALALGCAAAGQALRTSGWLGQRTASSPPLLALYSAYVPVPAGFALLAAHAWAPETVPESAGLHMWMVGGFGGMTLAIMSSMIRRRIGLAFNASRTGDAAALFWLAATFCRTIATVAPAPTGWLIAAAGAWAAAFALFLYDFGSPLLRALRRQPLAPRRSRRTESRW